MATIQPRQKPHEERPTEDEITKKDLGPRGVPGEKPRDRLTPDAREQMPKPLDPGHTA
jgi:hypothetical protein